MTDTTTPGTEPMPVAASDTPAASQAAAAAEAQAPGQPISQDARPPREGRRRGGRGRGRGGNKGQAPGQPQQAQAPADGTPRPHGQQAKAGGKNGGKTGGKGERKPARPIHPLLHVLADLQPRLFGARFLPLKVGIYEDLRAAHPEALPAEELKVALGLHTRSNRYLEAVASGLPRHDLQGQPTEPVAVEHVQHAITELYRRRKDTPQEPAARQRAVTLLLQAMERSGLDRDAWREKFGLAGADWARALHDEALLQLGARSARAEALKRAYAASGKTVEEFASMYGMEPAEVQALVG